MPIKLVSLALVAVVLVPYPVGQFRTQRAGSRNPAGITQLSWLDAKWRESREPDTTLAGIWSIGGDGLTVSRIPEAASHSISARNDPATICEGNRDLRARVTEANLHRLAKGTNLDALLAARWEQRRQTAIRQFEDGKQGHFPGFLEGDLGLHVPFFWGAAFSRLWFERRADRERALEFYHRNSQGIVLKRGDSGFPSFDFADPNERGPGFLLRLPPLRQVTSTGWRVPSRMEVAREECGDLRITVEGRSTRVSEKNLTAQGNANQCTAIVGPVQSFVAIYDDCGNSFGLFCLDTQSGRLLWRNMVRVPGVNASSGMSIHHVELSQGAGVVAVFGVYNYTICYVEVFSTDSGLSESHFSRDYCQIDLAEEQREDTL